LDSVAEDNIVPAKEGTAYLASRHRRIGLINGPQHVSTAVERRRAVLEQLEAAGSDRPEVYEYEGDYTRESGKQAIRYFMALPEPPTGLFSANNEMTYGVFLGLRELGLPADAVEIVSFGGLEFSSLFNHRMSYIRQSPAAVGESAADLALQCAANPAKERENRILVPRFVQNDEC
jgi:LacI family transcriptional regulator